MPFLTHGSCEYKCDRVSCGSDSLIQPLDLRCEIYVMLFLSLFLSLSLFNLLYFLSFFPSVCPSIHPSVYPSFFYPSVHHFFLAIQTSTFSDDPSIQPSLLYSSHPSFFQINRLFTCPFVLSLVRPSSFQLKIRPSVHLSFCWSILLVRPSIH